MWAWTRNLKIKSCILYWLGQPGSLPLSFKTFLWFTSSEFPSTWQMGYWFIDSLTKPIISSNLLGWIVLFNRFGVRDKLWSELPAAFRARKKSKAWFQGLPLFPMLWLSSFGSKLHSVCLYLLPLSSQFNWLSFMGCVSLSCRWLCWEPNGIGMFAENPTELTEGSALSQPLPFIPHSSAISSQGNLVVGLTSDRMQCCWYMKVHVCLSYLCK